VDHDTGEPGRPFAPGYELGNVFVENDTLYVTGTEGWGGERIVLFVSDDMEQWEERQVLHQPGWAFYNTSLCRAEDRYMLMLELGKPREMIGKPFTARFAASTDMTRWDLLPPECLYAKDRYTAPHCLRYHEGYFYNFYLEALPHGYEQYVVRSRDLVHWESSPLNPVLRASDDDRKIANPRLTPEQRERIRTAKNLNNSDIDFCDYEGRLIINYSWGDQHGVEHLAEATFEGSTADFLTGWFPALP